MGRVAATDTGTKPMTVADMAFMLDRLGQDCSELQQYRELHMNAAEAIERGPVRSGEIRWDVEWVMQRTQGVFKLCVVDNGCGMTGTEMLEYVNRLSSSGSVQAHDANFGVGAKIAGLTRNHAGLLYFSWKDGKGAMAHLYRDPIQGYGLRQLQRPDGRYDYWSEIPQELEKELKATHQIIDQHGTIVVLLGMKDSDNTMEAPAGLRAHSSWIKQVLNQRLFDVPPGVVVRARERYRNVGTDPRHTSLATVNGQRWWLDQNSDESGFLDLPGVRAHWWIQKPELSRNENDYWIKQQVGALYQGEIYEVATGSAAISNLASMGIAFGHDRIAIYFEPFSAPEAPLGSNTARTQLLINGQPLPYAEWFHLFRENMPDAIRAFVERAAAGADSVESKSMNNRLRLILSKFHPSRYRAHLKGSTPVTRLDDWVPEGELEGGPDTGGPAQTNTVRDPGPNDPQPKPAPRRRPPSIVDLYGIYAEDSQTLADPVPSEEEIPQVVWLSSDPTVSHAALRSEGDMEDRAARYDETSNTVFINADFRVYQDLLTEWQRKYLEIPGSGPSIQEIVREWYAQPVVETIIGLKGLRGGRHWPEDTIQAAWDPLALTNAAMPKYHTDLAIKRAVHQRFKEAAA